MELLKTGSLGMKFKLTFKDPDCVYEDVRAAINDNLKLSGLDEDEIEAVFEIRLEKVQKRLEKWVSNSEYVTIEFDLEKETCKVLENS